MSSTSSATGLSASSKLAENTFLLQEECHLPMAPINIFSSTPLNTWLLDNTPLDGSRAPEINWPKSKTTTDPIQAVAKKNFYFKPIENSENPSPPAKKQKKITLLTEEKQIILLNRIQNAEKEITNFNYKTIPEVELGILNNQASILGLEDTVKNLISEKYLSDEQQKPLSEQIELTKNKLTSYLFNPDFLSTKINSSRENYRKHFLEGLI